jgi:Zn finger protein HypA/HybF involved in hydrogenase expression
MVWQRHRCGQQNKDGYRQCMQCQTRKYICPNCGVVEYTVTDGEEATLVERIAYVLGID